MEPRVNEKYDLSQFLQGKRANVLKKNLQRKLIINSQYYIVN